MKLGNGDYSDNSIDAFGDAYEYLMGMYASNAGKSGGEYFTPQEVSELLTKLAIYGKTEVNKVYDPACGSGSLLLKSAKILGKDHVRQGFFGQEINLTTYNLCRINMFLHDIGYDKFVWPQLDEKTKTINLSVNGTQEGKITDLALISNYKIVGAIEAQTEARIFTENYTGEIGVGATSYSDDFPGVDYSGETVVRNGREFWLVNSTEFEDGWLNKMVYWQENNVVYTFSVRYKEVDEKTVMDLAICWMNSF